MTADFVGYHDGQLVTEVVAELENKGVVPLRITEFTFKIRGINRSSALKFGDDSIRGQVFFPNEIKEGSFIPKKWLYSFVYPESQNPISVCHRDPI